MSIHINVSPSRLFCHLTPSSEGTDESSEKMFVLDPKYFLEFVAMITLGISKNKKNKKNQKKCNVDKQCMVLTLEIQRLHRSLAAYEIGSQSVTNIKNNTFCLILSQENKHLALRTFTSDSSVNCRNMKIYT